MEHDKQQVRLGAIALMERYPGIGITDAYIIESARRHDVTQFISFDKKWKCIEGITVWTLPSWCFKRDEL